jgi:DHA2 family multidrug resistance protein
MLCGAAASLEQIVAFRLLQGVFGAALVPLSQAVLLDIYPRHEHGRAMAIWGAGIMVGPILGPMLGGWITENYNWRWVFYINLPIGILALMGIFAFVRESSDDRRRPFDLFGFAFLSLAIGALQMMLDRGEQRDWFSSTEVVIEAALAVIGLWVFIVHTFTSEKPFVDPVLFKDRNFLAGVLLMFMAAAVMYATLSLLPPMLTMLNYPVVDAGLLMSPRGMTTMICMIFVGRLIGRLDSRIMLSIGLGLLGLSLAEMTEYSPQMDAWPVIIAGLVQGAGLGFLFVPLSAAAFSTLPNQLRAEGSGIFSLLRNVGGSIGISISVAALSNNLQVNHAEIGEHVNPFSTAWKLANLPPELSMNTDTGRALIDQLVNAQASMIAYISDYKLMMIICFATIPLLLLLKPAKGGGGAAAAAAAD